MIPSLALLLASAAYGDIPALPARGTFPFLVRPAVVRTDTTSRAVSLQREADRLAFSGKFNAARAEYLKVIAIMDSSATFPGETLWALASMEYGRNRELRAAEILDQLADASVRYGRPEWQARALLEAGIIYQNHGRTDMSVPRARALKTLLTSPAITPSARAQIAERLAMR
jgi:hypothetical protein